MTAPTMERGHFLPAYVSQVAVNHVPYPGMIADTGSCTSLLTETEIGRFADAITTLTPSHNRIEIENVNGESIIFRGKATLKFDIAGATFQHEFDIMEGTPVVIPTPARQDPCLRTVNPGEAVSKPQLKF